MIKLSIPFTKDSLILSLVKEEHLKLVDEIYMPVPHSIIESARPYVGSETCNYESILEEQVKKAKELGLKVSFVANKQFIPFENLRSTSIRLCKFLREMKEKYDIDKVVLSNLYIIRQYGELIKSLGIEIELSVLMNIATPAQTKQIVSIAPYIDGICFGDELIHNVDALAHIKEHFPKLQIKLIPNHGCLVGCPFEKQHHNYSACTFKECTGDVIAESLNNELRIANDTCAGCRTYIANNGRNLNEVSFIRPEDIHIYNGLIDRFKLSGREHSADEVITMVEAYINATYKGSIERLLDMAVPQDEMLNENFPQDFGKKRSTCQHQCYKCNYCRIIGDFVKSRSNEENIEV